MADLAADAGAVSELAYVDDEHSQRHSAVAETRASYDVVTSSRVARSDTIAGNHGGTLVPFNTERAQAAVAARERKRRRITAEALVRAGKQIPEMAGIANITYWDTYGYAMEQHSLNMADPSAPGSAQSLKHIDGVLFPRPERGEVNTPADTLAHALGTELARHVLARLRGET